MLSLDIITLGVPEVQAAHTFYTSAFSPSITGHGQCMNLDMHGTGQITLHEIQALAAVTNTTSATSGLRGYVISLIVSQPAEVRALLDAAVQGGAKVLKPAKKGFFGGFSAVCQAPDGAIWKLAAASRKDTGPAAQPPQPTETIAFLAVARPKISRAFYAALGMTVDHDYGNKFVDFAPAAGSCKLGLMPRKDLAKDAGVPAEGSGFRAVIFHCRAESRDAVDALLAKAVAAGGQLVVPAGQTGSSGYAGHFTDPDGFLWQIASAER